MEVMGLVLCADWAELSVSSPVVEVKRTVNESPYTSADASTLRRDVIARGPTKFFQIIVSLRLLLPWHRDDLANWVCSCPRAIDVPVERLLLTRALPPIARGFAGQLPECRGEGRLGGIAKRRCDGDDRRVSVAQHVHCLLEPVLAQPGMR